ncbi:MAG: DUF4276 family protein [Sulfuricellaceae bacterium]
MVAPEKTKHSEFRVFVEGGGDHNASLAAACKEGFGKFFAKAGLLRSPRIVVCGGRMSAYEDFCHAITQARQHDCYLLLVDSEAPIVFSKSPDVWGHVKLRDGDGWACPTGATADNLHFMVECMENWFLADPAALGAYYGRQFKKAALPKENDIESVSKADVINALNKATRNTATKGRYSKGKHSFEILAKLDPIKIAQKSPFACRMFEEIRKRSGANQLNCVPS